MTIKLNKLVRGEKLNKLVRDERGAGMVEYIILVGVIALLAIVAFRFFGSSVSSKIAEEGTNVGSLKVEK